MPFQTNQCHGILLAFSFLSKLATSQQQSPTPPPPPAYNFSPTMATAVIVLIIFFFSIGFISVYIRHFMLCLGIVPGRDLRSGIEGWRRGGLSRGLDPTTIETFPTFLYSDVKMHRVDKSSLECAICLNEFTDHEILRMLPSCSHVFHPNCVDTWLTSHVTCPICRANLEISESNRSLSFNYLAHQQLDQPISSDDDQLEPSDHHNHNNQDVIVRLERSDDGNIMHEIKSVGDRIGKLPRSHSTGHSLVDDCERYTLRLPDEVRNKLVNVNLSGLPAAIVSPRVGYRARSVGCTNIEDIKSDHHWRFSVSPPFISRSGSARSQKSDSVTENNNSSNNSVGIIMSGPISLFKSIKSPINKEARSDDIGERSTNKLWVNRTNQDLELEAQWNHNQ